MSKRDVKRLHHPRFEDAIDPEDDSDEPATFKVKVCGYCYDLVYPEGWLDDLLDPVVQWPCPTIRELRR